MHLLYFETLNTFPANTLKYRAKISLIVCWLSAFVSISNLILLFKFMRLLYLLFISVLVSSCLKENAAKENLVAAKVIEFRNLGGCAHGWKIETPTLTFRAESVPNENELMAIANQRGFPIFIKLDFYAPEELNPCSDIYRRVTYWELKK
ncbi:MAG: hypothetical protein IPP72_03050 [Chitinophagaceae bacterium]|nr:hypothetical protein [Chitinophagaceae bacterium]